MYDNPDHDWVAVIYPQTGAVRLHRDLESAQQTISWRSWPNYIFKNRNALKAWSHLDLEVLWVLIYQFTEWRHPRTALGPFLETDHHAPDCGTEELLDRMWDMIQRRCDRVLGPMGSEVRRKTFYEINLDYLRPLAENVAVYKATFNRQARTILSELVSRGKRYYEEEEFRLMMNELVASRTLKTKQDPFLIFQYYRPTFIDYGIVSRGGQ